MLRHSASTPEFRGPEQIPLSTGYLEQKYFDIRLPERRIGPQGLFSVRYPEFKKLVSSHIYSQAMSPPMQLLESFCQGPIRTMVETYDVTVFLINRQIYPRNFGREEDACRYARDTSTNHSYLDDSTSIFITFRRRSRPVPVMLGPNQ